MMRYKRFVGGNLESNGYVLYQRKGGDALLIDPGYNAGVFLAFLKDNGLNLKGILLTHLHHDHVGAVRGILASADCPVYMHSLDAEDYRGRVDIAMEDGLVIDLEGEPVKVLHTPGHTRGSVCFLCPESKLCFTGDTVFDTDLGRTDLAGGSEAEMEESVKNVVDRWPNDLFILPGHDSGCTMAQVRKHNSEFIQIVSGSKRNTVWE